MAAPAYDAVLCDIDGVLRLWPPADDIERGHQLAVGTLAATAFAPDRLLPAITGQITDEQWRAAVAADIAHACGSVSRAHAAVNEWSKLEPRVNDDAVTLLRRAGEAATVALVSNGTTRLEQDLTRQGLSGLADILINTARIGYAKPDPRVYQITSEQIGVPLHRCLFIDDTEINVATARDLGMIAVHYRQLDDLRNALHDLPVIP
ncbi:HAD-IA family hydrolase [Nocardia sp. NPDC056000]|uniref:HAD-IA family hydrolase n=1 Tax=Nocardia sp. NPDC056000 TaxID=3345674 RepID=UPI0035E1DA62